MTKCKKCGAVVHERTNICPHCGFDRGLPHKAKICPKCDRAYPRFKKHCSDDGSKLVDPEMLVPKCVKCGKAYDTAVRRCPIDGGAVIAEAFKDPNDSTGGKNPHISHMAKSQSGKTSTLPKHDISDDDGRGLQDREDFDYGCDMYGNTYDDEDFTDEGEGGAPQESVPEKKKNSGSTKWLVALFLTIWIGPIGGLIALAVPSVIKFLQSRAPNRLSR